MKGGDKEEFRRAKRLERKARGMFSVGQRVMGEPGRYGQVTGHEGTGRNTKVKVWWDSGSRSSLSPNMLSHVKKDSI